MTPQRGRGTARGRHPRRGSSARSALAALRRRSTARRRARRAFGTIGTDHGPAFLLGIPASALLLGLLAIALVGVMIATSLTLTTQSGQSEAAGGLRDGSVGKIPGAATVVTESTLGAEIQDLLDASSSGTTADFDVSRCLSEQGIDQPVIAIEEVSWGPQQTDSWLVVYSTTPTTTIRDEGGAVAAIVVLPTCGTAAGDTKKIAANRLWTGSALVGPASP